MKPARHTDVSTVLTWYCGLYQCFRSQSHRIIWNTKNRHRMSVKCNFCVHLHMQKCILHGRSTDSASETLLGFHRGHCQARHWLPPLVHAVIWIHTVATVYFEDFLDCMMHVRLQVCTPPRQGQTVACDWQGKEEKKATEMAAARLQWGCEILSGNSYVNRQHFRAVCW